METWRFLSPLGSRLTLGSMPRDSPRVYATADANRLWDGWLYGEDCTSRVSCR